MGGGGGCYFFAFVTKFQVMVVIENAPENTSFASSLCILSAYFQTPFRGMHRVQKTESHFH